MQPPQNHNHTLHSHTKPYQWEGNNYNFIHSDLRPTVLEYTATVHHMWHNMGCVDVTLQASQCHDGCPKSDVAGSLACERPGEGAGWGLEGDPVIGCGALFISWGSAWGGRRVPVYKAGEKKKILIVFAAYREK